MLMIKLKMQHDHSLGKSLLSSWYNNIYQDIFTILLAIFFVTAASFFFVMTKSREEHTVGLQALIFDTECYKTIKYCFRSSFITKESTRYFSTKSGLADSARRQDTITRVAFIAHETMLLFIHKCEVSWPTSFDLLIELQLSLYTIWREELFIHNYIQLACLSLWTINYMPL